LAISEGALQIPGKPRIEIERDEAVGRRYQQAM